MKVNIQENYLWKKLILDSVELWLKGYIYNKTITQLAKDLQDLKKEDFESYILSLDGHYALVAQRNGIILAVVDKVRSIPLFYDSQEISSHAPSLICSKKLNLDAIISLKMSGFTIGEDTLYKGLNSLIAGQFILCENTKIVKKQYYQYQPWQVNQKKYDVELLAQTTLGILKKMIRSLNGRQVVIPLSAGNDSRLIASGLKELGYENVKCYSYGIKGNFEAKIAKIIAKRLGYEFMFIPLNIKDERKYYKSIEFKNFLKFADTLVAVQYFQSISTIPKLKDWIDDDAVFINGNGGDFMSGEHIKKSFNEANHTLEIDKRKEVIIQESIKKHFCLWGNLKTQSNLDNISIQLEREIPIKLKSTKNDHGLYEYLEFNNRQSKYVISSQRCYEFYGYQWRLPLWDDDYLNFWKGVPLNLKKNQKLYIEMLKKENWGNVWGDDIPINKKYIRPLWILPCLLYTSPSPRDRTRSRMPSSA